MSAAIRPSFNLDYCAWHATVIVLVEVTPSESVFRVVQSWKGELQPGETVRVAELTPRADAKPISFYVARRDLFSPKDEEIPRVPVGSRMVLFVKTGRTSDQPTTGVSASSHEPWRPADLFNEMKTSTIWMDGERLYSFQQLSILGQPSSSLSMSRSNRRRSASQKSIVFSTDLRRRSTSGTMKRKLRLSSRMCVLMCIRPGKPRWQN